MSSSLKRIMTVFNKDLKENTIVIIILLIIPFMAYFLPFLFSQGKIKICVLDPENYNRQIVFKEVNAVYEKSQENAMKLLDGKKVDAVVDVGQKTVFTYSKDPKVLGKLREVLATHKGPFARINIVNGRSSRKNYTALLCTLLIIMIGLIGNPIVFLSESKNDVISSLMLTPLSYTEFFISKALFAFFCSAGAIAVFIGVTGSFGANLLWLFIMVIASSLFIALISAIITLPFKSVEELMVLTTPISIVVIVAEVLLFASGRPGFLPIQSGFRKILAANIFPKEQIAILISGSVALLAVYIFINRRIKRIKAGGFQ